MHLYSSGTSQITYRDYTKFNKEKFIKDFASQSHNLQKGNLDTNTAYNNVIITLNNSLAIHAPVNISVSFSYRSQTGSYRCIVSQLNMVAEEY